MRQCFIQVVFWLIVIGCRNEVGGNNGSAALQSTLRIDVNESFKQLL